MLVKTSKCASPLYSLQLFQHSLKASFVIECFVYVNVYRAPNFAFTITLPNFFKYLRGEMKSFLMRIQIRCRASLLKAIEA